MHKCVTNKPSVSASEAVAEQADTNKTVLFRTNPRVCLEKLEVGSDDMNRECESEREFYSESECTSGSEFVLESDESESESDIHSESESLKSEDRFEMSAKPRVPAASRKEGSLRGRIKQPWTQEECKVLWECYVRSGGSGSDGYIKRLVEMWDGRDVNVRPQAALLGQLRSLKNGRRLSLLEKREIERKVTLERMIPAGQVNLVEENSGEEDIDFVVDETSEQVKKVESEGICRRLLIS